MIEQPPTPAYSAEYMMFITTRPTPPALWLFGTAHVDWAVAHLASELQYAVSMFDERSEWTAPDVFLPRIWHRNTVEPARLPNPPHETVVLIMTHNHTLNFEVLDDFTAIAHLWVIGSPAKVARF